MFTSKEYRGIGRNKLKGHWGLSVLVTFVAGLLGGTAGGGSGAAGGSAGSSAGSSVSGTGGAGMDSAMDGVSQMISENPAVVAAVMGVLGVILLIGLALFIIGAAVELGHNAYYIDLCTNREPGFDALFSRFGIFLKALGLRFYMTLFVSLWTLLFVIPGIIASYRYAMAPYIMAQNPNVGIREAVNRSKEMMAGNKWRLFCLQFSFIGWALVCLLTLGVGFLWLTPYMQASTAAFYLDVSGQGIPMEPTMQPQGV
ncbi:MAG: DUF975 family protein [Eubacteriales bacterium]|nr:DUF975 family protein [Eubacteriales bacterium]